MRPEVVPGAAQDDQIDPRILAGDTLQDGERPELVAVTLDDERRTARPEERGLVRRPRAVRRRDRMAEDHEGVGRLLEREERAHPSAEGTTDQGDGRTRACDQLVARGSELLLLGRVAAARPLRRERDARRGDAVRLEPLREPQKEWLLRGAAVAGRQDSRRHLFFAGAPPLPPRDVVVFFAGMPETIRR